MRFGTEDDFDAFVAESTGGAYQEAFESRPLRDTRLTANEPFGFADGLSQPRIDWQQKRKTPTTQMEYTNLVALGEFLLGYPNEYGKITDRPLLER